MDRRRWMTITSAQDAIDEAMYNAHIPHQNPTCHLTAWEASLAT